MSMYLPPGVSAEEFVDKWRSLHYGEPEFSLSTPDGVPERALRPTTKKFVDAHGAIKKLRSIALRGKNVIEERELQKQVVWSMPEPGETTFDRG
jgi:hypothetical protein